MLAKAAEQGYEFKIGCELEYFLVELNADGRSRAETDDWVAMASEPHAIAVLPGADDALCGSPGRASSTCGTERSRPDN